MGEAMTPSDLYKYQLGQLSKDSTGLPQFIKRGALYGDSLVASKQQALQRFNFKLGDAANTPCDMVFVGDSITTGFQVLISQRWQTKLAPILRSSFQPAGVTGGRGYFSSLQAIGTPADYPVVATNATFSNIDGPGAKAALLNGSGQTLVFTTSNCTSVKIYYFANGATGSWSYKVDAGAATTVPAGQTSGAMSSVTISGLGGTTHTITVAWVSGSGGNGAYINGFMEFNGDENAGLRFWDAGQSSVSCANLLTSFGMLSDFSVIQPALVTIELGANDWGANNPSPQTAAQFKANMLTLISGIYSNTTVKPSIVLMPVWNINPANGVTPVDTWANFVSAMYSIAAADSNVCVFDIRSRLNAGAQGFAGGLLVDGTHPSLQGSIVWARAMAAFLGNIN